MVNRQFPGDRNNSGSVEIVDPEPNARPRFESPSRQIHYRDRLLGATTTSVRCLHGEHPPKPCRPGEAVMIDSVE
jgi:hypothetical protein